MNKRELGKKYENVAKKYLIDNDYKIIDANYFTKAGEIDLIGNNEGYLCFIEVKYRDAESIAKGLFAVNRDKQKRIYNAARIYMLLNNIKSDTACRFDVVSIDGNEITLIKNAFP